MKFFIAVLLSLLILPLRAATYYVATNGNNSSDGSLATPWSNVWYAAKSVSAGDLVIIHAGEYNEFVTNTVSGTAGNSIIFTGERGAGGQWLTIIDPSTPISTGWITAPEVGSGVWKQTNLAFTVRELTLNHQRLGYVYTNGLMAGDIASGYVTTTLTNGFQLLALDSSTQLGIRFGGYSPVYFWDGIEALFCSTGSVCYLRLRDGSDPNGLNLRGAPNLENFISSDMLSRAIDLNNTHYVTYSNVLVRGAWGCFFLNGQDCYGNVIVSNYLQGGIARIKVGTEAHDNLILNNAIVSGYYGYTNLGAWDNGTNVTSGTRATCYVLSKYLEGGGSTMDDGIYFNNAGSNNVVGGNNISGAMGNSVAVFHEVVSGKSYSLNTQISNNVIEKNVSVGVFFMQGEIGTYVHHNLISDCNANLRYHVMNTASETNRLVYVYRNRLWLPDGVGNHIFIHFNQNGDGIYPDFWTYQNSFSGGNSAFQVSGYAEAHGGIPGCRFLNNIMSDCEYSDKGNVSSSFWTNVAMVGIFDYNLVTPPSVAPDAGWFEANNIKSTTNQWLNVEGMSFALPINSQAINAAIDVTQSFTINGTNYSALPYGSDVKVGPAWDMGALEAGYVGNMGTLRVGTLRGP